MAFLFLGFPSSWDKLFAVITGIVIVVFAYRLKLEMKTSNVSKNVPFVEHKQTDVFKPTSQQVSPEDINSNISSVNS